MTRQVPNGDRDLICPLHRKSMFEVCASCPLWVQLRGKHPQSNEEIDKWGCSLSFLPMLLIEGAQQTRQAGAAIESFRNEMVNANQQTISMMSQDRKLIS